MNKIILLLILLQVALTFSRVCNTNEKCVVLFECPELLHSSKNVRATYRCDDHHKYCCPEKSVSVTVRFLEEPKFPEDCGSTPKYGVDRVVGGRRTDSDEYSWLVSLEYALDEGTSGICGGSIINSLYVLTAAHCVAGRSVRQLGDLVAVRLGDFRNGQKCDYGTPTCQQFRRIEIEEIIVHEDYVYDKFDELVNDISLLRLKERIEFTDNLKPICLPFGKYDHIVEPTAGAWLLVSGWGRSDYREEAIAKRVVSVPLWEKSRCHSNTSRNESHLCAGTFYRDRSFNSYSGSPLMYEFENRRMILEGIVSYGSLEYASSDHPGVCTRVRSFVDWIESKIRM